MTIQQLQQKTYTSESVMGSDFYQWAHNTHLELHGLLFHVPNEVKKAVGETTTNHISRIQELVAQGLVKGIEDYVYLGDHRENAHHSAPVLIELKTPTGTASPDQKKIHAIHGAAGHPVYLVRTFGEWAYVIEVVILGFPIQPHHQPTQPI